MRSYWHSFYRSITQAAYYRDLLQSRLRFSIKYYFLLSAILISLTVLTDTLRYAPQLSRSLTETLQQLEHTIPQDFELTISPGNISSNQPFPQIFKLPGTPDTSLVIDPNGEIGDLEKYHTGILVNNTNIILNDGNGIQSTPLKDFPETRIDRSTFFRISRAGEFVAKNSYFVSAGFFLLSGIVEYFMVRMFYLMIFCLGLWLAYKNTLKYYGKAFQVSIHTITLPLLVAALLRITGINLPIPFWFMAIHTLFTFYILNQLEKNPQN